MLVKEYLELVKTSKRSSKSKKIQMSWGELWERYASRYTKPEEQVAIAISHYLHTEYPDLLWWHCPNEGKKGFWQQILSRLLGVRPGVPDIQIPKGKTKRVFCDLLIKEENMGMKQYDVVCLPVYFGFFCEIKAAKNKQTKQQKDIADKLTALGYYCCLVYSLEEYKQEWEKYNG